MSSFRSLDRLLPRLQQARCTNAAVPTLMQVAEKKAKPSDSLAPADPINKWMATPAVVDQTLGMMDRASLWCNLRLLRGLELDEFLRGSREAYTVVQQLTAQQRWDDLRGLLHPVAFDSILEAAEARPAPLFQADDITIRAAVLSKADVLEPSDDVSPGTCRAPPDRCSPLPACVAQ